MSSIVKGGFARLSGDNVRVIDSNSIVKKRMEENESNLLREADDEDPEAAEGGEGIFQSFDGEEAPTEGEGYAGEEAEASEPQEEGPLALDPEEVRRECEEMIQEATEKCDKMREEAKEYASQAADIARQDGFEEGKRLGYEELEAERQKLNEERAALQEEFAAKVSEIEPQMIEVITDVYNHVFGENFFSKRDVMVCLINRALLSIDTDEQVIINVSPQDFDILIGMKATMMEKVSMTVSPEIRQREDFKPGMAKIETSYGIIDCSIDSELRELTRVLRVLSYEGHDN